MIKIIEFSVDRPKLIVGVMLILTLVIGSIAVVPSLFPKSFPSANKVKVDTDPENMLPSDEPVRVFHEKMKKQFNLYDMIVVGVINSKNPNGVFNVKTLKKIHSLAEYAKTIHWNDKNNPGHLAGVVSSEILAVSTVDNIEPKGLGGIKFEWLMKNPPKTEKEALVIRKKAERIPMFMGTILSDGDKDNEGRATPSKAIALYIPLTDKHLSFKVATMLEKKVAEFTGGDDEFHITGLPVAEDTFGVEMFKQMAMSAPLAMLIIFLLMWYFFHKLSLIISPMIIAIVCIIQTMGLLVITGNTIHIMSSMIPIFIMPIAVLDAIHILSEFFDRYQETKDRRTTIVEVMKTLFKPMLFTSLTTTVGFASLALTPIPPVQTFGLFIAFGVMMAWVWTVLFVPAAIMFISQKSLENFGLKQKDESQDSHTLMSMLLKKLGEITYYRARLVLLFFFLIFIIAGFGIAKININDNPIKWFEKNHKIRIADKKLNKHFAGTYMAYLTFSADDENLKSKDALDVLRNKSPKIIKQLKDDGYEGVEGVFDSILKKAVAIQSRYNNRLEFLNKLSSFATSMADDEKTPENIIDTWSEAATFVELEKQSLETFKDPAVLQWIAKLQDYLLTIRDKNNEKYLVGKSSSLSDVVRTVYRELTGGNSKNYIIPSRRQGVAQTLMQYQNGHRPNDLWHFVEQPNLDKGNSGFRMTNLWIQLKSGDNQDMVELVKDVNDWFLKNQPPVKLRKEWFGLTYINMVWQDKMVAGMLNAFLGSFVVVLIMMIFLLRSVLWGLLSMIPLTVTIGSIYGFIGFIGKDYDMPTAVLSSLSLGLAIDYAIHFLARSRELRAENKDWESTFALVFGEPARAIARNILVVGVGFLPLLAAPLVPYKTVGFFIAAILITAGIATLLILPAMIKILEKYLFNEKQ